ncbi:MAG: hypothetical protein PG977_000963 [Bartonella clarridgeiae]|nr:MAG: hypothetical protein PG977_000963 [Bartonella clarridgeiae]
MFYIILVTKFFMFLIAKDYHLKYLISYFPYYV